MAAIETEINDAVILPSGKESIEQYFAGTRVFITGGTGFLGKLIIEKLLRTCTDIEKIYILVRTKKNKSEEKRFNEIWESSLFDRLKREQPNFSEKIRLVVGDCLNPDLGLTDEDKEKLINEVNCVFHCAATVRFDAKLRNIAYINVRATRDILEMAKKMKQLWSFVYISTAYSNCVHKEIEEKCYEPPITGEHFLELVEVLNDDMLEKISPILKGDWPNTYAFSKAVAESVVKIEGENLPVAIIRPSIVISTYRHPVAGWIDNIYGAIGVLLGAVLGLIHTMHCNLEYVADMVPADYVINCSIAAAWDIGRKKESRKNKEILIEQDVKKEVFNEIPIYNYVSSIENPCSWREFLKYTEKHGPTMISPLIVWYPFIALTSSYYLYRLYIFFLHQIPAYTVDFFCYCFGKKRLMVKGYQRIDKFLTVLSYFATQQWKFRNDNTQALWKKLNAEDQQNFQFDMNDFDWDDYFCTFLRGGRVYLLKDPLDTIPQGRKKYIKLAVAHYALVGLLLLVLYKLFIFFWRCVF